ncbi:hypothetical protein Pst134EA_032764 [Puccinia striiformis f. sp. tritici]|uniref:uncharacterized protein n=1 Tax=Puccinia striiformis f. sp. tritici TaxID=168172 RepID=UPI002008264A|nr:uncharacterized protein Pst134EA_032764 [Puccinia striiformis f. sp. tritici]KAH9443534.1 hypothetical protein Pst134EA_032764 [Puccinia striiformis f. sp. tritici]
MDCFPGSIRGNLAKSILSFPVTSRLASQVLLQILSNSSPMVLSQQCQKIIQPVLSAFTSATQGLRTIPSKEQLVKIIYLIRILTTMIAKAGSCALINLSDQITSIQRCYQPIIPSQVFHPPGRIVPGLQTPPKARLFSSASDTWPILRLGNKFRRRGTGPSNTDAQAVQCRLDALNCLRTIAQSDSKSIVSFLASSCSPVHDYITHQPYTLLNVIERDPPTHGFPTFHYPRKIASITIELHRRLGSLLKAPSIAPELTKEVLQVCEALAVVSAYHRISTPIVGFLSKPMIGLLSSKDSEIGIQSRKTTIAILQHLVSVSKSTTLDIKDIAQQIAFVGCEHLLSETDSSVSVWLWCDLLRTALPFLVWNADLLEKILELQSVFEEIPEKEEELKSKLTLIGSLTVFFPGSEFDATYVRWVRARLREEGLDSLDLVVNGQCERILTYISDNLAWDLSDAWDDVRAIRLLGIIVSKRCISQPLELVKKITLYLLSYFENLSTDELDEKSVSTHTWTLANCLETINEIEIGQTLNPPFDLGFWTKILNVTLGLLSTGSPSNTLKTNSVRIIGVAVGRLPIRRLPYPELGDVVDKALEKVFEFLLVALPKVQWAAASALRQILVVLVGQPGTQVSKLKGRICEKLCDTLESSSSFKVRIQVCLALQVVQHELSHQSLILITKTKDKLDDEFTRRQIPSKETEHAERLRVEIAKLLVNECEETSE